MKTIIAIIIAVALAAVSSEVLSISACNLRGEIVL